MPLPQSAAFLSRNVGPSRRPLSFMPEMVCAKDSKAEYMLLAQVCRKRRQNPAAATTTTMLACPGQNGNQQIRGTSSKTPRPTKRLEGIRNRNSVCKLKIPVAATQQE